jgi:hypothetical protein
MSTSHIGGPPWASGQSVTMLLHLHRAAPQRTRAIIHVLSGIRTHNLGVGMMNVHASDRTDTVTRKIGLYNTTYLLAVLYGCETWSLTLSKGGTQTEGI